MKSKSYILGGYKQRSKVCLLYLECQMKQDRHGICTFELKYQKRVERK